MKFTYGCELEIPDWNCLKYTGSLEKTGAKRNLLDTTIINSSGVSNDPKLRTCIFGGEINTKPTGTIIEQVQHISDILNSIGPYGVNHSQNLHLHIRIPGLKDNLNLLKQFCNWIYQSQDFIIENVIYPEIERIASLGVIESDEYKKIRKKFYNRRKESRARHYYQFEIDQINSAVDFESWYYGHCSRNARGEIFYPSLHRQYISPTQLKQTDTIEFRFFSFENSLEKIRNAFEFCQQCVEFMLNNRPAVELQIPSLPQGAFFDPKLEKYGQITKIKNLSNPKEQVRRIKYLLRDGIITESDLGLDIYKNYPDPMDDGPLVIEYVPAALGTVASRKKWEEKQKLKNES